MIYERLSHLTLTTTPTPNNPYPYVNSVTAGDGDNTGWIQKQIQDAFIQIGIWIKDGFIWIFKEIFGVIDPVIGWGSRFIIIACVIIYFNSGDRKYLSTAFKWGIIFLIYCTIKGALK